LPGGQYTGVHSKTGPIAAAPSGQRRPSPSGGMAPRTAPARSQPTQVASYGGYQSSGSGSAGGGQASTRVNAKLLNSMLSKQR
jgi:hypothetical protein